MSYCVNCGVELEKGCRACPLCDTPVINPSQGQELPQASAYPGNFNIPHSIKKRYIAFIISMVMLIPTVIWVAVNAVFVQSSAIIYIVCGVALAWVWFVFPLLWKKPMLLFLLAIDSISLLAYLYLFQIKIAENGWYSTVVLPVVLILWGIIALFILWLKKRRSIPLKAIAVLGAINIMSFVVEICNNLFYNSKLDCGISLVITACCVSIMMFFAFLAKSRRLKAWVTRKFNL